MEALRITEREGAVRFGVRVQPRSSRRGIEGLYGDALKVRVQAAPVDGAANDAVIAVLAEVLGVARSAVRVVSGTTARSKVIEVEGLDAPTLRLKLDMNRAR